MWYKIKELEQMGLNFSQISRQITKDRGTVRKYTKMSEEQFCEWVQRTGQLPLKLQDYGNYVKDLLESYPYLSAAQVEDRLKETYSDLPEVHSKTVYNFVERIRKRYRIKKKTEHQPRQFEKLPEPPFGQYAQADFGQYQMLTLDGRRKKVYFFAMVLCRSRQKFLFLQSRPFTTATTIDAHNQAFEYFKGEPRLILYDQDRVLVVDENLGDILLTEAFNTYSAHMSFEPIFCRKSDPQSKGKVENVVKYVKINFLRGRKYESDASLNSQAMSWLSRTANAKKHSGTKKVPQRQWEIERNHLLRYHPYELKETALPQYKVRKDNTISYHGNFYALPLGTYAGSHSGVFVEVAAGDELRVYDQQQSLLTTHKLCYDKGQTIRNTDCRRDKSASLSALQNEVAQMFSSIPEYAVFIDNLILSKNRYLRDNLAVLKKNVQFIGREHFAKAFGFCNERNLFNGQAVVDSARYFEKQDKQAASIVLPSIEISGIKPEYRDMEPRKSNLSTYLQIM